MVVIVVAIVMFVVTLSHTFGARHSSRIRPAASGVAKVRPISSRPDWVHRTAQLPDQFGLGAIG